VLGAGVDGTASGRDAVALGAALARDTDAELMLIAIHEESIMQGMLPRQLSWSTLRKQARAMLARARDERAPDARIAVEADTLVWPGLRRAVALERRELLVVGSAGRAELDAAGASVVDQGPCPILVVPRPAD
jgi:hypothetical protein